MSKYTIVMPEDGCFYIGSKSMQDDESKFTFDTNILTPIYTQTFLESITGNTQCKQIMKDKTINFRYGTTDRLYLKDNDCHSVDDLKAKLEGKGIQFELQSEKILDITDLITEELKVAIESNGTLTLENDARLGVPHSFTYLAKGV